MTIVIDFDIGDKAYELDKNTVVYIRDIDIHINDQRETKIIYGVSQTSSSGIYRVYSTELLSMAQYKLYLENKLKELD